MIKSVLLKTTGYSALIEVLRRWLLSDQANQVINDSGVAEKFAKIKKKYEEKDKKFIRENYPAGNQGVIVLRNSLLSDLEI